MRITILFILFSTCLFAQVGINTTDPKSLLDIRSSNENNPSFTDGLLVPKGVIFPSITPTINQDGMLFFLKNNTTTHTKGFYYWDGVIAQWISINNSTNNWALTGNSINNTHFIGTINDQNLQFRRNNSHAGAIFNTGITMGLGAGSNYNTSNQFNNTIYGNDAMNLILTSNNTAIGTRALKVNSTGYENTALGTDVLSKNTIGFRNTAVGIQAMGNAITANNSCSFGAYALYQTSGNDNVAFGNNTLFANTTGKNNSAVGNSALKVNTTGINNSGVGFQALLSNTTGYENNAFGTNSLQMNTVGWGNNAFGSDALNKNTIGSENTAIGAKALLENTTGVKNCAIGTQTLRNNTSGNHNLGIGMSSLLNNTTGDNNVAAGRDALLRNTTGSNNVAVGFNALSPSAASTGSNNIAIGANAQVPNANTNNQVRIGDTSITYAGIQVPWTTTSDIRYKKNIVTSPLGLDFVAKLNPVLYERNENNQTEFGFIAQEIQNLCQEFKIDNSGIYSTDSNGYLGIRYNDFIAILTKAIQEQQLQIEQQQIKIEKLIETVEKQNKIIDQLLRK